ncbi:MAG: hypothetical protein KGO82_19555, partial [Bacteroidota bacterium]|nr:hypothetical protein [Bacteroidota bacterium]
MKKMLCYVMCFVFVFACKKADKEAALLDKDNADMLQSAREYFEKSVQPVTNGNANINSPLSKVNKLPQWDHATVVKESGNTVLVVPLQYDRRITANSSMAKGHEFSLESISTLRIAKEPAGFRTEIVVMLPDTGYQSGVSKKFSGITLRSDWSGKRIAASISGPNGTHALADGNQPGVSQKLSGDGCAVINWYDCGSIDNGVGTDCVFLYTEFVGCGVDVDLPPTGSGGGGSTVTSDVDICNQTQFAHFNNQVSGSLAAAQDLTFNLTQADPFTKRKDFFWTCFLGAGGGWRLKSHEIGYVKLINPSTNTWAWKSLTHDGISMSGTAPLGTSVTFTQGTGIPSFTP